MKKPLLLLILTLFLYSCSDDAVLPDFQGDYLVEYELVETISRAEVLSELSDTELNVPGLSSLLRFDVELIRITYNTVGVNGEAVVASGALFRPVTNAALPILSFQRGTLNDASEAPSLFQSVYSGLGGFFAATGYVVAMPDFLGYGISAHIEHPYIHRQSLATATRDMIRASREYFKANRLSDPLDKLFITGYSQGGYASLATIKLLEEQHAGEFKITAATAGGGPYNVTASVKQLLATNMIHDDINTFIWMIDVFNKTYPQLNRPYTYYYNEPWATRIAQQGVFAEVEKNPSLLLTPEFINGVINGSDQAFLQVMADNDIFSWKPKVPLQLYHGTADERVPYLNALTAYQSMTALNANKVELIPIQNGLHLDSFFDYLTGTFSFFMPLYLAN